MHSYLSYTNNVLTGFSHKIKRAIYYTNSDIYQLIHCV